MADRNKRPLVKTAMTIGGSASNAIASVSKGCSLGAGGALARGSLLMFDCIKCGALRGGCTNGAVGIGLTRRSRRLGSIIIATLKVGHRRGKLKCTARAIGKSVVADTLPAG